VIKPRRPRCCSASCVCAAATMRSGDLRAGYPQSHHKLQWTHVRLSSVASSQRVAAAGGYLPPSGGGGGGGGWGAQLCDLCCFGDTVRKMERHDALLVQCGGGDHPADAQPPQVRGQKQQRRQRRRRSSHSQQQQEEDATTNNAGPTILRRPLMPSATPLQSIITGVESAEPICDAMFDALSAVVDHPSPAGWRQVKSTRNMKVLRNDEDGIAKFLTVMSAQYGRGIPPSYPPRQFTDHEFCVSMVDEIQSIDVLGCNSARQQILHTRLQLPVIKNRDMVCVRAFRETGGGEEGAGPHPPRRFEMMERSTTHPDAPLGEREGGFASGRYIRAYQFAYSRITAVRGDPHSHVGIGIVAADLRGAVPYGIFNRLFAAGADATSSKLRKACAKRVVADGLPPPPKVR
jgi:hypothetical protein